MSNPQQKRQERAKRLADAAVAVRQEADATYKRATQMTDVIPLGQPILVGHHSEGRDRRYRDRIHNMFGKAFELQNKAERLAQRAAAAELNDAIFKDDPDAMDKIEDKIELLEARRDLMKKANTCARKKDLNGLADLGYTESQISELMNPKYGQSPGYPSWELSNLGANIRRYKDRLIEIEQLRQQKYSEEKLPNGVKICIDPEINRIQLYFPGKPVETLRYKLKTYGFRWTPSLGCWQAYINANSKHFGKIIANDY